MKLQNIEQGERREVEREEGTVVDYDWCGAWYQFMGCILPNNKFWEWNSFHLKVQNIKRESNNKNNNNMYQSLLDPWNFQLMMLYLHLLIVVIVCVSYVDIISIPHRLTIRELNKRIIMIKYIINLLYLY